MSEETSTLNAISVFTQIISSILKRCTLPAEEKMKLLFDMKLHSNATNTPKQQDHQFLVLKYAILVTFCTYNLTVFPLYNTQAKSHLTLPSALLHRLINGNIAEQST